MLVARCVWVQANVHRNVDGIDQIDRMIEEVQVGRVTKSLQDAEGTSEVCTSRA